MAITCTHTVVATSPNDATKEVSSNAWNAGHVITGAADALHTHTGVYEPANANLQGHVASAHAPANAQANADITKAEIEAKLTGVIASHSHSGGSDPWTYIVLANDFTTSSTTNQDVTGMGFTPDANTRYEFEWTLMLRTATATVGPRACLAWPTGMTDGVATVRAASTVSGEINGSNNINTTVLNSLTGVPNNTQSWPAKMYGIAQAGASPSGQIRLQLSSETAGTNVTVKAGSILKYRVY